MSVNLWFFLSICVIFCLSFTAFVIYLSYKKEMKELDIKMLRAQAEKTPAE